jgi:predicted dehydrogenase
VLDAARQSGTLLWEAFVFPFHRQIAQVRDLVADRAIGELMEIKSNFHFQLSNPGNIRYSRDLEGGALNDVGCYPIRLAAEFFGVQHEAAWAGATWGGDGVDVDTWGVLEYPGGRRLHLSCGLGRSYDTHSSLEGTAGRIEVGTPLPTAEALHDRPQYFTARAAAP